ncbi:MAG TPA: membrane protein [bacterium]|nr:membrane protein [bacterium]
MRFAAFTKKFTLLMVGLFLYSVGILLTIHARLGTAPWDTFQIGLVCHTNFTLGRVSQLVGIIIIGFNIMLKEIPGWGTILNMYFIGYFIDIIETFSLIPPVYTLVQKIIMLLVGIAVLGWATYLYMGTGWGAGPRDGLMLGLSRRLSTEVWKARTAIEVIVAGVGFALGAQLGIGTIIFALLIGPAVQLAYRIGGKEPEAVLHRTLMDDFCRLKSFIKKPYGPPPITEIEEEN